MPKFFKPTIYVKGLILVAIPLLFELTFGTTMFALQKYYREVIAQETKCKSVIYHANEMWLNTTDAVVEKIESKVFNYVQHSQTEEEVGMRREYEKLKELVKDEPERMAALENVKRVSEMLLATGGEFEKSNDGDTMSFQGKIAMLRGRFTSFQRLQTQLKAFGRAIRIFREPDVLRSRDAELKVARMQSTIDIVIVVAVLFSVAMNAALLLYFMRGINNGIQGLMENTSRMSRSEELLPESTSEDELGHLDRAFHKMAKTVETATRRERSTINNAGDMICVINEEFGVLSVNPAGSRLLGMPSADIKTAGLPGIVLESDFAALREHLKDCLSGGQSASFECRLKGTDDRILWMSWNVQWSVEDREYFCVAHDVTERKRMEQMKQEFFGMISHDMRTPLSSILASVGFLLTGAIENLPEKATQYLKLADQSAQYLLSLMQDLLDMERLEAGAFPLNVEQFDFVDVLKQAAEMVGPLAAKAGLTVTVPEGSLVGKGDRDALTRVVVNLISNAIKFSPGGSSIDLAVKEAADAITVEVVDHGRGIPEELQGKVFERFKQVEIGDAKKKGGSGLGLAICKGFIEAHGGTIGVRSKSGEGSTFWFSVPA